MHYFKLEVYVPAEYGEKLKAALALAGAGRLGNYDSCIWQCAGTGQFRPLAGSTPFRGQAGEVEYVSELKLEMIVSEQFIANVITALKENHPYETPAFQYWRVETQ